jgi:hypothetical protein
MRGAFGTNRNRRFTFLDHDDLQYLGIEVDDAQVDV